MPLKHATETLLVVILAIALALAGLAVAILPTLPAGTLWRGIAFALGLAYPLSLYPLLKSRRADYTFRALHFAPFVLLLIRFVLDLAASFIPGLDAVARWYSWAWAAPAVIAALLLVVLFCIRVLRQRDTRLKLIASVLLPFLFLGVLSQWTGWNTRMAAVLAGNPPVIADTGTVPSPPQAPVQTGVNLDPSQDAAEERWRALLRDRELRKQSLEGSGVMIGAAGIGGVNASHSMALSSATKPPPAPPARPVAPPPRLVSAGGEDLGFMAMTVCAAYCGVVHARARKRKAA